MFLIPSTPKGPTPRHPHREVGWEESWKAATAVEDTVRRNTQGNCSRPGDGGPLCVHVRPWTPEQHRRTPSLRGGMLRKGKGEKSRAAQREREAERGGEWLGERGEEEGSGRLADVTSALNQSLKPQSHGCCPLMPLALLDLPQAATPQSNTCILHKLSQYITAI